MNVVMLFTLFFCCVFLFEYNCKTVYCEFIRHPLGMILVLDTQAIKLNYEPLSPQIKLDLKSNYLCSLHPIALELHNNACKGAWPALYQLPLIQYIHHSYTIIGGVLNKTTVYKLDNVLSVCCHHSLDQLSATFYIS